MDNAIEPEELALDELRSLRSQLQHDDDALSYVRRLVQARLDLVLSERQHRISGLERSDVTEDLRAILGEHLVASDSGLPRPPRPTEDASDHRQSRLKHDNTPGREVRLGALPGARKLGARIAGPSGNWSVAGWRRRLLR